MFSFFPSLIPAFLLGGTINGKTERRFVGEGWKTNGKTERNGGNL
jgi:hypothetical protein